MSVNLEFMNCCVDHLLEKFKISKYHDQKCFEIYGYHNKDEKLKICFKLFEQLGVKNLQVSLATDVYIKKSLIKTST